MNLSEKLLKFHYFFKAFVAYILANAADLMISSEQKTVLSDDWDDWDEKHTAYTTPNTHNTVKAQIRDNHAIVLSGEAMVNLNIKTVDRNPSKVPPPDFAPSVGIVSVGNLKVELFVFDPNHLGKKAKPKGAKFIGSMVAYTGTDAPAPALSEYTNRVPEGKTTFPILYSSDKLWSTNVYSIGTGINSAHALNQIFGRSQYFYFLFHSRYKGIFLWQIPIVLLPHSLVLLENNRKKDFDFSTLSSSNIIEYLRVRRFS